jgi:hypothetical protein
LERRKHVAGVGFGLTSSGSKAYNLKRTVLITDPERNTARGLEANVLAATKLEPRLLTKPTV